MKAFAVLFTCLVLVASPTMAEDAVGTISANVVTGQDIIVCAPETTDCRTVYEWLTETGNIPLAPGVTLADIVEGQF